LVKKHGEGRIEMVNIQCARNVDVQASGERKALVIFLMPSGETHEVYLDWPASTAVQMLVASTAR